MSIIVYPQGASVQLQQVEKSVVDRGRWACVLEWSFVLALRSG